MNRTSTRVFAGFAALLACAGLATSAAPVPPPLPLAAPPTGVADGVAIIEVVHEITSKPLAGMPVYVTPAEGAAVVYGGFTDDDGTIVFKGLEDGDYVAMVAYNNHFAYAKFAMFSGPEGTTRVTIYFNPDID